MDLNQASNDRVKSSLQVAYLLSPKEYIGTDLPGSGYPAEVSSVPP